MTSPDYDSCPDCGEPLSLEGRFCKDCGWDQDLVESPDAHLDGIDLPGTDLDEDDYHDFLDREGLDPRDSKPRSLLWTLVVMVLIIALLMTWVL